VPILSSRPGYVSLPSLASLVLHAKLSQSSIPCQSCSQDQAKLVFHPVPVLSSTPSRASLVLHAKLSQSSIPCQSCPPRQAKSVFHPMPVLFSRPLAPGDELINRIPSCAILCHMLFLWHLSQLNNNCPNEHGLQMSSTVCWIYIQHTVLLIPGGLDNGQFSSQYCKMLRDEMVVCHVVVVVVVVRGK